jgi:hypothetical protein
MSLSSSEDRPFVAGDMQIIVATGASDSMVYHAATRHATVVKFFGPSVISAINETDTQTLSFRMNSVVPTNFTTYMCQAFALPVVPDGSIVRVNTHIQTNISSSTLLSTLEPPTQWPTTC